METYSVRCTQKTFTCGAGLGANTPRRPSAGRGGGGGGGGGEGGGGGGGDTCLSATEASQSMNGAAPSAPNCSRNTEQMSPKPWPQK